jgi:hypothetical protein
MVLWYSVKIESYQQLVQNSGTWDDFALVTLANDGIHDDCLFLTFLCRNAYGRVEYRIALA